MDTTVVVGFIPSPSRDPLYDDETQYYPGGITTTPLDPDAQQELASLRAELGRLRAGAPVVVVDRPYVKVQDESPTVAGIKRSMWQAANGAIFGLWIGLQMGSRDWNDLLWGALIGAAGGFIGRNAETQALDRDVPRANPDERVEDIKPAGH